MFIDDDDSWLFLETFAEEGFTHKGLGLTLIISNARPPMRVHKQLLTDPAPRYTSEQNSIHSLRQPPVQADSKAMANTYSQIYI